jgi:hypothetical protein
MRTNINLATQPYEDARQFTLQWSAILGGLLFLALLLSYAAVIKWHQYRQMSASIAREKNTLAEYDLKQAQDLAILSRAENQDVRERSEFLNGLIRRKEISWTKIFTDLEKMMPPHLRVLSVQPQIKDDQILVKMKLGGDSRDRAAELVRRMEKSRTFRNAQVLVENTNDTSQGQSDPLRFEISSEYVPSTAGAKPAATTTTAENTRGGL